MLAFDRDAPKKATNLTVNSDLLARARALGINLSEVFETSLAEIVRRREAERFREEARQAMEDYNEFVREHGIFGEEHRSF